MSGPTIISALDDPATFGPWFAGSSWDSWRIVLKAAYGLGHTLAADERAFFAQIAGGREVPRKRVKRLVCIIGRRGGKDSIASAIAAFAGGIEEGHVGRMRPGEKATIACIASDRDQARIVHSYINALLRGNEELSSKVVRETRLAIELDNNVEIVVVTNSFRSTRGRTYSLVILDECATYRSEESANPDIELWRALEPGLATLPESMAVFISTPYRKGGLLYDEFAKFYGKDDDRVLVIKAPSLVMNPSLDPSIVERALEDDPEAARAEWLAEFRSDISDFISRELIESAVEAGVTVRAPRSDVSYVGAADAASGVGKDSFAIAIAHREGDTVVLDLAHEIRPPFNPQSATTEVAEVFKSYRLATVVGDKYSAGFLIEAFASNGIEYKYSERDRSQIYIECLPLFTSGRARLVESKRLVTQFCTLERRTSSIGRDRVDHGRGDQHDDLCNAVALAMVTAGSPASFDSSYRWAEHLGHWLGMPANGRPVHPHLLARRFL